MGRGRLRRGYSLEVIFEEEALACTDFCSTTALLNSLDSVNQLCNITKTLEEEEETERELNQGLNHSHSRDNNNYGYLFEQEENDIDEELTRLLQDCSVEIVQQHNLQDSERNIYCKSLDGLLYARDMDSCFIEWEASSTDSLLLSSSKNDAISKSTNNKAGDENESRNRSRVSRRQIVEANWLIDENNDDDEMDNNADECMISLKPTAAPPIPIFPTTTTTCLLPNIANTNTKTNNLQLTHSSATSTSSISPIAMSKFMPSTPAAVSLCYSDDLKNLYDYDLFPADAYPSIETFAAIDICDEVNSTISAESISNTAAGAVNVMDSLHLNGSNDKSSNTIFPANNERKLNSPTSIANISISPTPSATSSVAKSFSSQDTFDSSNNSRMDSPTEITTDVKRVRALFENTAVSSDQENSSSNNNSSWKRNFLQKKALTRASAGAGAASANNTAEQNGSNSSISNSGSDLNLSSSRKYYNSNNTNSPKMRSAFSQVHLNQMEKYDFVDLLVNDKIIIEDSPDLFQKQRSKFQDTDKLKYLKQSSESNSNNNGSNSTNYLSLRRSKSLGAGLHNIASDEEMNSSSNDDIKKSRPCILEGELPAPDTVKNARTVFEKLVRKNKSSFSDQNNGTPSSSVTTITFQQQQSQSGSNLSLAGNNQIKKTLSSIKSNPTSKIFRSESMRDDSKVNIIGPRFGKPVLLNSYSNSLLNNSTTTEENLAILDRTKKKIENGSTTSKSSTFQKNSNAAVRNSFNNNEKKKAFCEMKKERSYQTRTFERKTAATADVIEDEESEEPNSFLSIESNTSTIAGDENDAPRLISPDILNRIRSYGTSITFFGGEIVAKTVKNRNLIFPQQKAILESNHNSSSSTSEEAILEEIPITLSSNEIFFSARPNQNQNGTTTTTKNSHYYHNHKNPTKNSSNNINSSGIDFSSFRFMDIEAERFNSRRQHDDEDNIPRIISVEPKSQPNSPTKSNSPTNTMTSSIIAEGRNSPEGCESTGSGSVIEPSSRTESWINNTTATSTSTKSTMSTAAEQMKKKVEDSNNNCIKSNRAAAEPSSSSSSSPKSNNKCEVENGTSSNSKKFSEVAEGAWF